MSRAVFRFIWCDFIHSGVESSENIGVRCVLYCVTMEVKL